MGLTVLLIIVVVGFVFAYLGYSEAENKKAITRHAGMAYATALAKLKESPTDPNLRSNALSLGRDYSSLTRDRKGVALFDEVSISNDLNAACAAAAVRQPAPTMQSETDLVRNLRSLSDLKSAKLIGEDEFDNLRATLLSKIVSA